MVLTPRNYAVSLPVSRPVSGFSQECVNNSLPYICSGCFRRNGHYVLREMLAATNKHTEYWYTRVATCQHCIFLWPFRKLSTKTDRAYHTLIGYRMYNRFVFPRRLRMSVSYSEAGVNVPTFSQFRILVRLCRLHEPSRRTPGRPSPGEIEAGGHGSGRSTPKGSPRVDKCGERSDFYSDDHTILDLLHIFIAACVKKYREITFSKPKIMNSLPVRILQCWRTINSKNDKLVMPYQTGALHWRGAAKQKK